jgi:epoxyqueuosine reductase
MKRAKLRGLKRNAAVVLGNPSTSSGQAALAEDIDALTRALGDEEPLVREHAAWALRRLDGDRDAPLRPRIRAIPNPDKRLP